MSFENIPTSILRRVLLGDLRGNFNVSALAHSQIMQTTDINFMFERVSFGKAAYKCMACFDSCNETHTGLMYSPTFSMVDKDGDLIEALPDAVQAWINTHTQVHQTMFQWAKDVIARGR